MSQPLGDAVGNALDVVEAVALLRGEYRGRLRDLAVWFAARGLEVTEGTEHSEALERAERALDGGEALDRFRRMIEAQGGDPHVVDDPVGLLPRAPVVVPIVADRTGTLAAVDAEAIGLASGALGAGRMSKGDPIDPAVGIVLHPKIGDRIMTGDPLGEVHSRNEGDAYQAVDRTLGALILSDGQVDPPELIHRWLDGGDR
jgi:pyrimidine-nucleoside phosphorylase